MIRDESDRKAFLERYKMNRPSPSPNFEKYQKVCQIGEGAFAWVFLYKEKSTGKYFACKRLEKEHLIKTKMDKQILEEKRILNALDYPFVISMTFSWKDNDYLYFFLPFVPGGDMLNLLTKYSKKFTEPVCQFFAAQLLLAINYLHDMNIIHRDIKPENVLVEANGYIKLADFGVAVLYKDKMIGRACGSVEYMSPEMLHSTGYGKSTDWWSYGVFTYEMCFGRTPFHPLPDNAIAASPIIMKCEYKIPKCNTNLRNFISNILVKDIKKRLGCNGIKELMEHKWFENIKWTELELQKLPAPFKPTVKSAGDTSNFDFIAERTSGISRLCLYETEFKDA